MNATSLLLTMMSVVLCIALILTFGNLPGDSEETEREKLRREIAALEQESRELRLQNVLRRQSATPISAPISTTSFQTPPATTPSPAVTPAPVEPLKNEVNEQLEEMKRQLDEERQTSAELQKENEKANRAKNVAEKETSWALKERTKAQMKRERDRKRVEIAMTMGTISAVNLEYGFVVFKPASGQEFSRGRILGVRRNSGILGQITVQNRQGQDYIADLKRNAYAGGMPPVQEGDELIVLPASYRAPGEEENAGGNGNQPSSGNDSSQELLELLPTR